MKTSKGPLVNGVCSNYLAGLAAGIDRAKIAVRTSAFWLPKDSHVPMIMVGAGTGLALMLGFLEDLSREKAAEKKVGKVHLFFGCRTESHFIYKDLIERYQKDGLIRLNLAVSRSKTAPKKYVQDLIHDMGAEVYKILVQKDIHFYICGDAWMADGCYEGKRKM